MRTALLAFLLLATPLAAQTMVPPAPVAASRAAELAARLPGEVAGWTRRDVTDFEARPGGAGMGAAVEYRPMGGSGAATVYVFDRGQPARPEDAAAELRRAQEDIQALAPMRQYVMGQQRLLPELSTGLRCVVVDVTFASGTRADSFACVGVVRSWFVKLRLTVPAGTSGATPLLEAFGRAAAGVL